MHRVAALFLIALPATARGESQAIDLEACVAALCPPAGEPQSIADGSWVRLNPLTARALEVLVADGPSIAVGEELVGEVRNQVLAPDWPVIVLRSTVGVRIIQNDPAGGVSCASAPGSVAAADLVAAIRDGSCEAVVRAQLGARGIGGDETTDTTGPPPLDEGCRVAVGGSGAGEGLALTLLALSWAGARNARLRPGAGRRRRGGDPAALPPLRRLPEA